MLVFKQLFTFLKRAVKLYFCVLYLHLYICGIFLNYCRN